MGGGKSRALCEEVWDWMLEYPGISIPIFRQLHTAIVDSTRKTFMEQVIPAEIRHRPDLIRTKESQGFDFCEIWNGSKVSFVGLDNPGKWFSNELGAAAFDEAHEIDEEAVLTINSRLRQRCAACIQKGKADCEHMPHRMILTFNPAEPDHWLRQWFILGATPTEWGWYKERLIGTQADHPIGDAEYFLADPRRNPFLPPNYIEQSLAGLSTLKRRRYLEGLWEHISGQGFFDQDALSQLTMFAQENPPMMVCEPEGNPAGHIESDRPKLVEKPRAGRMMVYKAPVRWTVSKNGDETKAHRYVVAVDPSTGAAADYSGIQVIDVDDYAQVAEWQGKVDPDRLAVYAFLTACVYNGAMIVPETTGGWGHAITERTLKMIGRYNGPQSSQPTIYTRPVLGRLSKAWTDVTGFDTNIKTRSMILDNLEESLRDGSLDIRGERTIAELAAFTFPERKNGNDFRSPRARAGYHDDLVMSLAIGAWIASRLPRNQKEVVQKPYVPMWEAAGY